MNKETKVFLIFFAQNIDCGHTLNPPRQGSSNEYPHAMFWNKNKKNRRIPVHPSFTILIWGMRGIAIVLTKRHNMTLAVDVDIKHWFKETRHDLPSAI